MSIFKCSLNVKFQIIITYDMFAKSFGIQTMFVSVVKGRVANGLINKVLVCSQYFQSMHGLDTIFPTVNRG